MRFPYNLMNLKDEFVQVIDRPGKRQWELRSRPVLAAAYFRAKTSGIRVAGPYDKKVFGFTGRPSGDLPLSPAPPISVQTEQPCPIWTSRYYYYAWGRSSALAAYPKAAMASLLSRVGFPLGQAARTLRALRRAGPSLMRYP